MTQIHPHLPPGRTGRGVNLSILLSCVVLIAVGCASDPEVVSYQSVKAHVMNELGLTSYAKGDRDAALANFEKALAYAEAVDNREEAIRARINISQVLIDEGRLEEAEVQLGAALRFARDLGDDQLLYNTLAAQGKLLFRLEAYEKAERLFLEALELAEDLESGPKIAMVLNDLGVLYMEQGRLDEAMDRLQYARHIYENLQGPSSLEGRGAVYKCMAAIHETRDQFDDAWDLLTSSLACYQQIGDAEALFSCHMDMALLLEKWGRSSDALLRFERAYGVAKEIPNPDWMEISLINILRLARARGLEPLCEQYGARLDSLRMERYGTVNPP